MQETIDFIKKRISVIPKIGLILGSGLGVLVEDIKEAVIIPYKDIPNFPVSTVEGHTGKLVIGYLKGVLVFAMQGRFHHYEGYDMKKVTFPIRIMQGLGINYLIVTNAAGGINLNFKPGTIMLIEDHINLMGGNPLVGPNLDQFGPRFPDMSRAYDPELIKLTQKCAEELNIIVHKGVYAGVSGPSYETPAEIRFLRIIGADAVGMSTVPEVIVANHGGMSVLGISCITNMAAGVTDKRLSHEEVIETAEKVKENFKALILKVIQKIEN